MKDRAIRRHHLRRMQAKARRIAMHSFWFGFDHTQESKQLREEWVRKMANNLHSCSCSMCCNRRSKKSWVGEVTRQEFNNYLKFLEEMGMDEKVRHCRYGV